MEVFFSKHRMSTFVAGYSLIFATLALLGYYMVGSFGGGGHMSASHGFASDLAYYDLPRMTISLGGAGAPHMRLDLSLEASGKDIEILKGYQPRITERINVYLGNLRPDQVKTLASSPWLREEMLKQINSAGAPVPVHDVMFRQLVVM